MSEYGEYCGDLHDWIKLSGTLERELAAALARLADIEAGTIHSCHDHCQRPECVLRRERDEARAEAEKWRRRAINGPSAPAYRLPWEFEPNVEVSDRHE